MAAIVSFFSTPARQALGWTLLGLLGISMAAGGVWFLTGDGDSPRVVDAANVLESTATPTLTRTAAPSSTSTPSPSPTVTESPTATATPTRRPASNTNTGTGGAVTGGETAAEPTPEPTAEPEPTQPPVVAGGAYCPPTGVGPGSLPSGRVAGAVKVSGANAAAGTIDLFVAFDGVLGPSTKNLDGSFRIDFYANVQSCANRVGAAISVYANGQFFPTGRSVGDGAGQLIPVTIELP
jgi:hypothetical protein